MKKRLEWLVPYALILAAFLVELILGNFVYLIFVAGKTDTVDYSVGDSSYAVKGDKTQFGFNELDLELNAKTLRQPNIVEISKPTSKVKVYVLPTNEELMIAMDTERLVSGK
jgi:acetate kinase